MEEVAGDLLKPIARIFLAIVRALIWLSWELMIQIIGWSIGWVICRAISFGCFPKENISEVDGAPIMVALIVEMIGLALLLFLAYWLTQYVGQ